MGESRALCVALASLIFFTNFLGGCAGSPEKRPASTGAREAPASTDMELSCSHHPYGEVKNGTVSKSAIATDAESAATAAGADVSDAGKILLQNRPLDPLPPEIARIQTGMVKRFVGKFVNDGLLTWSGVDLDRRVAIAIERRVFDRGAHRPRQVSDPQFSRQRGSTFARKWSEAGRTEVEVVSIFPISPVEAQAFVCAANPAWASKGALPDEDPDEMADGDTDFFLLDRHPEQGVSYRYTKTIALGEGLAVVLGLIWQHAPAGPAW
ncbi:MAG: hypothetical protein JWM63_4152 [Gammaproteobacteria bacterium]|jgi:hypothetical protein|nr:hypothetical protein [Gammaproteobacteria bacterium]